MMISLSAGIIAMSSFLPQASLVVNATPGVRLRVVEMTQDGAYREAKTFIKTFRAGRRPRIIHVGLTSETKALCAETIPDSPLPNTLSVRYRSCSHLPPKPTIKSLWPLGQK